MIGYILTWTTYGNWLPRDGGGNDCQIVHPVPTGQEKWERIFYPPLKGAGYYQIDPMGRLTSPGYHRGLFCWRVAGTSAFARDK
jgi:hypothetical protein